MIRQIPGIIAVSLITLDIGQYGKTLCNSTFMYSLQYIQNSGNSKSPEK